jgi:hypothetical protein
VWRSPDEGVLIDITPVLPMDNLPKTVVPPLLDTEGHLLFLPDAKAFERANKFLPLTKNKALEWQLRQCPGAISNRIDEMQKLSAGESRGE